MTPLAETFRINNNVNLYLLDAIPDEHIGTYQFQRKKCWRTVCSFYNVRLMWLQVADPALMKGLEKFRKRMASLNPL
jgi:hypothetical protein